MPPAVPEDILDRLNTMAEQIRELQGRVSTRPAQNQVTDGTVVIGTGGTLKVLDTDGSTLLFIGGISPLNPDGTPQRGLLAYRQDGTLALSIANTTANVGDPQAVVIRDARGNTLLAEDVTAGGLALPWLAYPTPGEEDTTRWPKTNATTWATIGRSRGITLSPRLRYHAAMTTDGGTTGQIRLRVNGTAVATGAVGSALVGTVTLPSFTYNAEVEFELQAQCTSGAGFTYGITRYLYGVQS